MTEHGLHEILCENTWDSLILTSECIKSLVVCFTYTHMSKEMNKMPPTKI